MSIKVYLYLALASINLFVAKAEYVEKFDQASFWSGSVIQEFSEKSYRDPGAPLAQRFLSNWAQREVVNFRSQPFGWRIASIEDSYFRFECEGTVTNFSFWLARESGNLAPDICIRYSLNSGASWTVLYNGDDIFVGSDNYTFKYFVSADLKIEARAGYKIYIELYKFSGAPILIDDFVLNGKTMTPNTVFMQSPVHSLTNQVGNNINFLTQSAEIGYAQIGYGKSSNNIEWCWLDCMPTNLVSGYGGCIDFWLMPTKWYFGARWIVTESAATNYGWNAVGQTAKHAMQAELCINIENSPQAVIWDFVNPFVTTPTQGPASSQLEFKGALEPSWPGDETIAIVGFTSAIEPSFINNFSFLTELSKQIQPGFFFSAKRDADGPVFINVDYNDGDGVWFPLIVKAYLDQPDCWYMFGSDLIAATVENRNVAFRVSPFKAQNLTGKLFLDQVHITAVPEPCFFYAPLMAVVLNIISHYRRCNETG